MISRPRNRKRRLASLVLVLGLGGWALSAPFVLAQGGGGGWQGLGFGGFGDGFGGYGGAFGFGVYPGTIGVGPGGMGFGMPGWGALQAGAGFNPARFNFDHSAGYRQPGYGYPSYPPGYGYGYGNGFPPSGDSTAGFDPLSAYAEPVYPAGSAYPLAPMPAFSPEAFQRSAAYVAPGAGAVATVPPHGRYLGIDEEPVLDANGRRGIRVGKVYPGTAAELSGLKAGDVIHSINGYRTEARGNLAWIIANAASNNVLKMNVLTASDGQEHSITATIR